MENNSFRFYVELPWVPLNEVDLKRSRYKQGFSPIRRPEILRMMSDKIYEVSDPFLFYTDIEGEYEWIVYEFSTFRVVKFRLISSNEFKMCIKSKVSNIKFLETLYLGTDLKVSIFRVKKFNSNIYNEFENSVTVSRTYNYICDLIGRQGKIYLSLGKTDQFLIIGKTNFAFHAKVQANFVDLFEKDYLIQIVIFDMYYFQDQYLRIPYLERIKFIDHLCGVDVKNITANNFSLNQIECISCVKVKKYELCDIKDKNNKIIVDNDTFQYLEWSKEMSVIGQYISKNNENVLRFDEGEYEIKSSNQSDIKLSNGEVVKYIPSIFRITSIACDDMKIDNIKTCKFFSHSDNYDDEILQKISYKNQIINQKNIVKNYASGKTLVVGNPSLNIGELEYDEILDTNIPSNILEIRKLGDKYHTIVIDKCNPMVPEFIEMKKKLILFKSNDKAIDKIDKLSDNNPMYEFKDAGIKTFIFLVGTIGSGKSALIRKVRTMVNMSGYISIAQIDKLIEGDIEFMCKPDTETYWKLRNEIYNAHMDQLIGMSIVQSNSIILETTHVNNEYVQWLKSYEYKIVVAIVSDTYENICDNIKTRNMLKDRKTTLSKEEYLKFESSIIEYTRFADIVLNIKPEHSE